MDPVSIGVIGTAFSAGMKIFEGIQGQSASRYQAEVAKMNQETANTRANLAIQKSQIEQEETDSASRAFLASQEAVQSASGLDIGGGSARLARRSARELSRKDALNVRYAGELEAYAERTNAANYGAQAAALKQQGSNLFMSGLAGAGGSLISGAARIKDLQRFERPGSRGLMR